MCSYEKVPHLILHSGTRPLTGTWFLISLFLTISCWKKHDDVFPVSHPTLQQQGRRAELGQRDRSVTAVNRYENKVFAGRQSGLGSRGHAPDGLSQRETVCQATLMSS